VRIISMFWGHILVPKPLLPSSLAQAGPAFGQGLRLALPVLPLTSSSLLPLLSHR
jgi:tellurite resistance protein TehA-like permease